VIAEENIHSCLADRIIYFFSGRNSMSTAEVFRQIDDPIYSNSLREAPISGMSKGREAFVITTPNGYGDAASPLNGPNNKTPIFEISGSNVKTLRFSQCALRLNMIFCKAGDPAAPVPQIVNNSTLTSRGMLYNSPDWCTAFDVIRSVTLWLNGQEVYKSSDDANLEMIARVLRSYSHEQLESTMDNTVFTPCFNDHYSYATSENDAAVLPTANLAGYLAARPCASRGIQKFPFAMTTTNASDVPVGADPGPATQGDASGYNPELNNHCLGDVLRERANRWCKGNTHLRTITKYIPFSILFPSMGDAIFRNLNNIKIEIRFAPTFDHLIHTSAIIPSGADPSVAGESAHALGQTQVAGRTYQGEVRVIKADLYLDSYTPEALKSIELAASKAGQDSDILPMLTTELIRWKYTPSNDFILPSKSNVDTLMMFKPTRQTFTAAAYDGGNIFRRYQSNGQFHLFTNGEDPQYWRTADNAVASPNSTRFMQSLQVRFDSNPYPSNAIEIVSRVNDQDCFNPTQLYHEYLKATKRLGRLESSPAVPLHIFKSTMPFAMIRPWSDESPHRSPPQQITIQGRGGTESENCCLVLFRYVVYRLLSSGEIQKFD